MKMKNVIISGVAGTLVMTLFSQLVSKKEDKDFNEPRLLATIEEDKLSIPSPVSPVAGWASHLGVGIGWALVFDLYKKYLRSNPSVSDVLKFGTIGGIAAIGSWRQLLDMCPGHSPAYYRKFFSQLFIDHLIFFLTISAAGKLLVNER